MINIKLYLQDKFILKKSYRLLYPIPDSNETDLKAYAKYCVDFLIYQTIKKKRIQILSTHTVIYTPYGNAFISWILTPVRRSTKSNKTFIINENGTEEVKLIN